MDFSKLSRLQVRGLIYLGVGAFLRLISAGMAFADIANIVMLFGLVHLSIHLWEHRHVVPEEELEDQRLFEEFLQEDEKRRSLPRDEARAAFIAWRDTRHYTA